MFSLWNFSIFENMIMHIDILIILSAAQIRGWVSVLGEQKRLAGLCVLVGCLLGSWMFTDSP